MTRLIATLGTSPGGIIESFLYLVKVDPDLNDIVVIATSDPLVQKAYNILLSIFSCCVKPNFRVMLSKKDLPFPDISSSEDLKVFYQVAESIIEPGDYVDITGGRKAISVVAAMAAMNKGAKVLTTIIPQNEYTRINNIIKNMGNEVKENCSEEEKKVVCSLISQKATTIFLKY